MLLRLLRVYLRPHTKAIVLVVLFQFVQTLATLYLPTLNADIIDNGVIKGDTGYILRYGGIMLGVALVQIVCAAVAVYFGAKTAMGVGRDIRAGIFDRVQTFSVREVGQFGAPSLITRTTNDVQQVQLLVVISLTLMVSAPIMCVGGILMALNQDVPLSALLLVIIPVLVVVVTLVIRQLRPLFRTVQKRIDTVNRVMREQITGIRVIRAFVRDGYEQRRFAEANGQLMDVSLAVGRLMAIMFPAVMLVMNLSSVAVLWFGGHRIGHGMEIGALTAFLSYLMQILMSVMMATFMFIMVPRAEVCAERIEEVLDTDTSVTVVPDPVTDLTVHGELELRNVEFGYPGAEQPVLSGIDLTAHAGQTTAIIGSTGSGKTTLLNLVPRLFDATRGRCSSTASTSGSSTRHCSPAPSAWCRRSRTCSPARWAATCVTATRPRPTTSSGTPWRWPRPATSWRRWRRAWTRRSGRAARTSPAVSGSGSRSPGCSSSGRRSTCSTTRSRRWTMPPTPLFVAR
ncbi:hypothetical protein Athai_26620 [Actinocatenispora thailandica]|uniref:ABC transmembrane type-1 domain-containing protein n=1 Tax=Actinocatenispora thailandica TaxID=227318 RepID=A0A7R7DP15_9ACTN|nr:hypothetical protein Athai_26620 [Actinocatenispora thailandica]